MEYLKSGNEYLVRLDRGESVMTELTELIRREKIQVGALNGLGATDEVTIGILDTGTKEIVRKTFTGDHEIGGIFGTITTKNGEPYIHAHVTVGNVGTGACHAGHLVDAKISATAEFYVRKLEGRMERRFDEAIGLDLMEMV